MLGRTRGGRAPASLPGGVKTRRRQVGREGSPAPTPAWEVRMEQDRVTNLLEAYEGGDRAALDRLLPLVYDQLRRIAHRELQRERRDHTLSTTEVVHEAYLGLLEQSRVGVGERVHFLAVAATAVRRALIVHARRRDALKRGAGQRPLSLDEEALAADEGADHLLALDEALTRLAELDARLARVVECRYFGGLTEDE